MLERVVHAGRVAPPPAHAAWVSVPDDVNVEQHTAEALPLGWDDPHDLSVAREVGARWYSEGRSAVLIVPSVPGRPFERNVVINATHVDWPKIEWEAVTQIPWDPRFFA
jgi:hypothetical protein